jgi:hypothetical protein
VCRVRFSINKSAFQKAAKERDALRLTPCAALEFLESHYSSHLMKWSEFYKKNLNSGSETMSIGRYFWVGH